MIPFVLKKLVSQVLMPLPFCLSISYAGLCLLWFTNRQKAGKIFVSAGLVLLTLLSYNIIADGLLRPFEESYRPFAIVSNHENFHPAPVKYVVVLGGGHRSDPELPLTSQLYGSTITRLIEGIRIQRKLPGSKLVLSGGSGFDPIPNGKMMADLAFGIGIKESDVIVEGLSQDTVDEAGLVKKIVGDHRFVMVTSASHMPRAMAVFNRLGMEPIPAPTDHKVRKAQGLNPYMFFPGIGNLGKSEKAFKEFLGTAWARLRGQI